MRIGAEQFTGQSGVARRDHKLHAIYRWLVTFHFTTRALVGAAVGLKAPPVRLLRWAERAGLLAWHRYPTYGESLLMLTDHGRREAVGVSRIPARLIDHEQLALIPPRVGFIQPTHGGGTTHGFIRERPIVEVLR